MPTSSVGMAMAWLSCSRDRLGLGTAEVLLCPCSSTGTHSVICRQGHSMDQLWQGQAGAWKAEVLLWQSATDL